MRRSQPVPAAVDVAPLQWGCNAEHGESNETVLDREFEVVLGSDICYTEESVPALVELVERLHAPLALIIGPVGRPSMRLLRERLAASPALDVEERLLTLLCSNPDAPTRADDDTAMRSGGVHLLLVVRPAYGI
jgi:predicted nicotinamide N-methyase